MSCLVALNAVYRRSASAKKAVLARAESVEQNNIVTLDEPLSRWFGEASPKQEANVKKVSEFLMTINPEVMRRLIASLPIMIGAITNNCLS